MPIVLSGEYIRLEDGGLDTLCLLYGDHIYGHDLPCQRLTRVHGTRGIDFAFIHRLHSPDIYWSA